MRSTFSNYVLKQNLYRKRFSNSSQSFLTELKFENFLLIDYCLTFYLKIGDCC